MIAVGLSETKVENERPRVGTIPESTRVIPGKRSESDSEYELPIEAESRLATKVTVLFWGCWWFRKVDPGGVGGEDGGTNYR